MYCIHFFRLFNKFDIYIFRVKHLDCVTPVFSLLIHIERKIAIMWRIVLVNKTDLELEKKKS